MNGRSDIDQRTSERILSAARELNYVVDRKASGLRLNTTNTLALIVICRPGENRSTINPFYFALLGSVAAAASQKDFNLLVCFQDGDNNFQADFVESGLADAVIVIGTTTNTFSWALVDKARARGVRPICWGKPGARFDAIRSDNIAGGATAAEHLIGRGCRDIIFLGPLHSTQRQYGDRYAGYAAALTRHNIVPRPMFASDAEDRHQQGYDTVVRMISEQTTFDGIFAACDMLALGALQALRDHAFKVPHKVALIGFDGLREGNFCEPGLSTVEPDLAQTGSILVGRALSNAAQKGEHILVPGRLVLRGTA